MGRQEALREDVQEVGDSAGDAGVGRARQWQGSGRQKQMHERPRHALSHKHAHCKSQNRTPIIFVASDV